jgi:Bacterial tandem repeat domain 1
VAGYNVNGEDRYAAIWEMSDGRTWQARHGLTPVEYQQAFDELVGQGYRLVDVTGY